MRLDENIYKEKGLWASKGYHIPAFDVPAVMEQTKKAPRWLHFGAGNIFRAFIARAMASLLEQGLSQTGIIVAEGYDGEIIDDIYRPHDLLSLAVHVDEQGHMEKSVVNSVTEALHADKSKKKDWQRLKEIFVSPSLQMVSFTITEKGYELKKPLSNGSFLELVASLLLERYGCGGHPLALVSMDNCSRNGERLWQVIHAIAEEWENTGKAPSGFVSYVDDPGRVAFPWTMIDKITPRPSEAVEQLLTKDGVEGLVNIETSKHTFIASFVNAEAFECLVIEDSFPGGRPPLEAAGFLMTDRLRVEIAEKMKVGACLNPLHTALAIFGCLLRKDTIALAMADPLLSRLVHRLGFEEGLPAAPNPGVLSPKTFLENVLGHRLCNAFIPDTPARIATDTSHKISVRFGQTVTAWQQRADLDSRQLEIIPLVLAGWCRYLLGTDDLGQPMALSSDPCLDRLCPMLEAVVRESHSLTGEAREQFIECRLGPLFYEKELWGCDLEMAGLIPAIVRDFSAMLEGPGAVLRTLEAIVGKE